MFKCSCCVIVRDKDTADTGQEPTKMNDSFQDRHWHNQSVWWVSTRIVQRTSDRHWRRTLLTTLLQMKLKLKASALRPGAISIEQRIARKSQTRCLTCHTSKEKGMAHATSSGHAAEMAKCSGPSQTDVIFVAMDALDERVSCSPMHFFSTASDPREGTTVVFWKEDSGRQPKLIFPENEGADETDYPSPLPNFTFFDDPDVPIGPQGPPPPGALAPPGPSGPPGLPPGWPPTPPPAGGKRARILDPSRERLPQRPSPPEPQLIPIPMSDGDDDQPPQDGRQRQRQQSRSRERVHPHAQVPRVPQLQPMVNPEPDDVSDEDFTARNPHHHQLDHRHWLNREVAAEEKIQIAWASTFTFISGCQPAATTCCTSFRNSADSDSGNSRLWWRFSIRGSAQSRERSFKVTTRTRRLTETGSTNTERKENYYRKSADWFTECQKAQVHGCRWGRSRTSKRAWKFFNCSTYWTSTPTSSSTSSKLSKDQLQVQYLIMKTVSKAMNVVHKVRIPKGILKFSILLIWGRSNRGIT